MTLPEEEYQQLRARAQSVDGLDDPEELMDSSNDSEQFANAGKLWVKLDQTTKVTSYLSRSGSCNTFLSILLDHKLKFLYFME